MHRRLITGVVCLAAHLLLGSARASAQNFEFLPEVDAYYKINRSVRLNFQAKETREAGDPTQAEIGPGLDIFVKPLEKLKNAKIFDPAESKTRVLQLFAGYRYVPSGDKPTIQRLETGFIVNLPLVARIMVSDRNRFDLDWQSGGFNWRYRNRVKVQRAIHIGSYNPAPYVSAEPFYQSQYGKWGTTALYAGSLFPVSKHVSFDVYYEHQNITTKAPNRQWNQLGVMLELYF